MKNHFSETYPWLKDMLRPLRPCFMEAASISLFTSLLALAVPIFTLQVYDRVVAHQGTSTLVALLIGVLLALGFDFVLRQSRSRMLQRASLYIDAVLGRKFYESLSRLPLRTLENRPASYWQSLFNDIAAVRTAFSGPTAVLIADMPFALVFLGVIFAIATPVGWTLLVILPLFVALTWFSSRFLNQANAQEKNKELTREKLISELLFGRATVKALGIDRAIQPEWERLHATSIRGSAARGAKTDTFATLGYTLAMLTTVAIISVGALAIIDREMTMGGLIASNMLASRIISPFNQLVSTWKIFSGCRLALERLDGMFTLPLEREEAAIAHVRPKGRLTVDNVTYHYHADLPPVLQKLSLDIPAGEIIGLVGKNGSGKTTLIKLMQGLYTPGEGRILLDGGDLNQFSRAELAEWIGYVPQECFLFSGTVKENISRAWPEASDEAIMKAALLSGADAFIRELPEGYATEIGEGGARLSGGQRQRLAIARALLRDPAILLLDEISSSLDIQSEIMLRDNILRLAGQKTVVMATHSIVLLQICSRLVVLEKGQLAIMGPTQAVLAKIAGSKPVQPQAQEGKRA